MNINDYQQQAAASAIYPRTMGVVYPTLGLTGEAGEVAEKVKKVIRDHQGQFSPEAKVEIGKELGDVLLQVLFQCDIREEQGAFTFDEVVSELTDKLIRRHPHVFGEVDAKDTETVLRNWERIKQGEHKAPKASALDGVPEALPALLKAQRTQHKAAKVGFDWQDAEGPEAKIVEELAELKAAVAAGQPEAVADEYGDVLFSMVNLARHIGVDAESALRAATAKFAKRFRAVEARVKAAGKEMKAMSLSELDAVWDAVKAEEP